MIPISNALQIIKDNTGKLRSERVDIAWAVGRVLAEDIVADTDLPPFDRSQMDGYAVRANNTRNAPAGLKVVGESAAGRGWHRNLKSGEAVRIMTGAPVPEGADAVQKIELTRESDLVGQVFIDGESSDLKGSDFIHILEPAEKGKFIVRKGAEVRKGTTVFKSGEVIAAQMIATMAAFGYAKVKVAKRPRIAILSTGSEIVEIHKKPKRDQIRNSNSVMLDLFCRNSGAECEIFPLVKDDIAELRSTISDAAKGSDILVITGGVSVGKYDLTKAAMTELGAEIFFDRVRLKPGKPTVFGRLKKTLIFGLPGNPVSAAATYYLFVRYAIRLMQNASEPTLREGHAVLAKPAKATKERDTYLPGSLTTDKTGRLIAEPLKWMGSSDFVGFARADCMIFVPRGKGLNEGEVASIVFLGEGVC